MNLSNNNPARQKPKASDVEDYLVENNKMFELANFYRAQGKYLKAIHCLKNLLKIKDVVSYKLYLADCYIEKNSHEQALLFLNQIIEEIPSVGNFFYVLNLLKVECLVQVDRSLDALDLIESLKASHFEEEEVLAWEAINYIKLNELDAAQESYSRCIEYNLSLIHISEPTRPY